MNHSKNNLISRHKILTIVLIFMCLLVALFVMLPTIVVSAANNYMAKDSPYFSFHINDVDFKFFKGEYAVNGITGTLKKSGEKFLSIHSVNVNIPWKTIFDNRIVNSNVIINNMDLQASQNLLDNAKLEGERIKNKLAEMKKDKKPENENKESNVRLEYLALTNSNITIHDFLNFKGKDIRKISDINVLATNLIPAKGNPNTDFQMTANVFGPAPLNVIGVADTKSVPPKFDMNIEMKKFDMPSINPFIREKMQTFIQKGKLDLYSEVVSEGNIIKGYAKPFVSNLKMDAPKGGFNFTGVTAKSAANLLKVLLNGSETKTIATRAPFSYVIDRKKLDFKLIPVMEKAVMNKVRQNIKPGLEDNLGQKGLGVDEGLIQAQEAR